MNRTVYFKTLGCKVNQYETQGMRECLLKQGFREIDHPEEAEYFVLNSCTVTHESDRKTLYYVRRFRNVNPQGKVVITGCLAKNDPAELLARAQADVIIPNKEKVNIAHYMGGGDEVRERAEFSISSFKGHAHAFVKIQDGCNMQCSYCKVRLVRGPSCSRDMTSIIDEVARLAHNGYQEIVLTGIHLGDYGKDLKSRIDLIGLLRKVVSVPGLTRVRLSSIEPFDITPQLIDYFARNARNEKICPHFHVPLQSGDDRILRSMRRAYTGAQYIDIIKEMRSKVPSFTVSTDVIVGFPGEDDAAFQSTVAALREVQPFKIHIFPFSPRVGTDAYEYPERVSPHVIKERERILYRLNDELFKDVARGFLGTTHMVLVEKKVASKDTRTPHLIGRTPHYFKVIVAGEETLINTLVPVKIVAISTDALRGVVIAA